MKKALLGLLVIIAATALLAWLITGGGALKERLNQHKAEDSAQVMKSVGEALQRVLRHEDGSGNLQEALTRQGINQENLGSPFGLVVEGGPQIWLRPVNQEELAENSDADRSDMVVAYDRSMYESQVEVNVVFGDGQVRRLPARDFERRLESKPNREVNFQLPRRTKEITERIPANVQKQVALARGETLEIDSMGMTVETLTEDMRQYLKLFPGASGVLIRNVESGSGAEQAGLHNGMVVESMWHQALENAGIFAQRVAHLNQGDQVTIVAWQLQPSGKWERRNFIVMLGGRKAAATAGSDFVAKTSATSDEQRKKGESTFFIAISTNQVEKVENVQLAIQRQGDVAFWKPKQEHHPAYVETVQSWMLKKGNATFDLHLNQVKRVKPHYGNSGYWSLRLEVEFLSGETVTFDGMDIIGGGAFYLIAGQVDIAGQRSPFQIEPSQIKEMWREGESPSPDSGITLSTANSSGK